MAFHPFEVNVPHLAYAFLGGFVVIFGLFSLFIKERLYVGEAVVSTIVGIIIGPYVLNLLSPDKWGGHGSHITDEITLEVTRVVLAIGVFAIGVELPKQYMKRHWRSLAMLLGPAMVWGWLITALFVWAIFPGHNFVTSLAIAACVTPTDPILAQAVIGGKFADKHVPAHIRHLLSAESGSNDGAAFPFLYIAIYIILDADDRHAVGEWFYITWLYEVILGIIIGALLGFTVRKVMKFSERKGLIDRQSFVAQYVSLAVFTIGITTLLGSDDLLAAFACGTAFAWDGFFNKATEDSMFSNVIDLLFNCAGFIYIGAIIPFDAFQNSATNITVWRLICFSLAVLALRRLPIILAMYKWIPDIKTIREAAFVGWFGPMGVGAIFISTLARTQLPEPHEDGPIGQAELLSATIQPIVAFLVLASVLCHGLSIPFFSLTKRVHSITHTWSRQSMGDEPAWATHARRIRPGESIRINRDDDGAEVVDDGTADRGDVPMTEKNSQDNSSGSSDQSPNREQPFDGGGGERADCEAMENGTYAEGSGERPRTEDDERVEEEDDRETPILAEYREGNHLVRERKRDDQAEVEVQVIRDYFHDSKPSQISSFWHPQPLKRHEVDKLHNGLHARNAHYAADEVKNGGDEKEDRLGLGLMGPAAEREDEAEEAEKIEDDRKRQLNMTGGDRSEREEAQHADEAKKDKRDGRALKQLSRPEVDDGQPSKQDSNTSKSSDDVGDAEGEDAFVDEPEEMGDADRLTSTDYATSDDRNASQSPDRGKAGARRRSTSKNVVYIHSRPTGRRRESIRQQVFAKNHPQGIIRSSSPSPSGSRGGASFDEGEAGPSSSAHSSRTSTQSSAGLLHPDSARPHQRGRPILSPKPSASSDRSSRGEADRHGNVRRDPSPSARAPGIRFAPDTAESSETAPGPRVTSGYYGKRGKEPNSNLSMYRTSSIQSNSSARSGRDRAEAGGEGEAPAGERYYKKPSGGSGLGMYRSRSVQDIDAEERDVEAEAGLEEGEDEDAQEKSKKGGFLRRLRNR